MASFLFISLPISNIVMMIMIMMISTMMSSSQAISSCGGPCRTLNDCEGQLICINGKCNDDPDVGTRICSSSSSPPPPPGGGGSGCSQAGTLTCNGRTYPTYQCSPPMTSSTAAKLTNNDFSEGGDGGGPSFCTGRYYPNTDKVVALSTGWFAGGSRCGRTIRIRAANGRTTTAQVVDECDSMMGCDEEHAYQPPCKNNIVDGSDAVWTALGLDKNVGIVDVTWSFV